MAQELPTTYRTTLAGALREAEREEEPVCILGTSFAFVHLLDHLRARGMTFRLPAGSRVMDTGGYKGRSREVSPAQLRHDYVERFGIRADHCINEYGMTEMCSQFYDSSLRDATRRRRAAWPWRRPSGRASTPWCRHPKALPARRVFPAARGTGCRRARPLGLTRSGPSPGARAFSSRQERSLLLGVIGVFDLIF
jgi:hypothetical protein